MATAFKNVLNLAITALGEAITDAATEFDVATGGGVLLPSVPFYAVIVDPATLGEYDQVVADTVIEIVLVTAKATDTLTVTRAQEGTSATAFGAGDPLFHGVTAAYISDIHTAITALETVVQHLNASGTVFNDAAADVDLRAEGVADPNLLYLDAGNDRVGIGTATPAAKLDVVGGALIDGAVVINESGADVDARVEGDTDANLVYVDAGNDRVGIGTATPASKLDVNGSVRAGNFLHLGTGNLTEVTIASGVITVTESVHIVDTEADAASDDLVTINGGAVGTILVLRSANAARDVTVKDGTGNIQCAGDFVMNETHDIIVLIKLGASWFEVCRSSNL